MGFYIGWRPKKKITDEDKQNSLDYQEEKRIIRLDFERAKYAEELKTHALQEQLRREEIQNQILEKQADRADFLADLQGDDDEEGEGKSVEDQALMALINGVLSKNQSTSGASAPPYGGAPQAANHPLTSGEPGGLSFSSDQIREIFNSMAPIKRAMILKASPDQITSYLKQNYPTITNDTIHRAISFIEDQRKV